MTHRDSPEFLAILGRVPRWHMLTPGVDVWRENDEYLPSKQNAEWVNAWEAYGRYGIKEIASVFSSRARRPVPEHVQRSEAWWALYNQLATVAPIPRFDQALSRFIITMYDVDDVHLDVEEESEIGGLRGFNGSSEAFAAIKALGGEAEIIKNLQEGPGAYMRWVLEVK